MIVWKREDMQDSQVCVRLYTQRLKAGVLKLHISADPVQLVAYIVTKLIFLASIRTQGITVSG